MDELEKVKTQLSLKLSGAQDQLKQKVEVLIIIHNPILYSTWQQEELVSRKETELARAEETIRRERQDFQETRQRVSGNVLCVSLLICPLHYR